MRSGSSHAPPAQPASSKAIMVTSWLEVMHSDLEWMQPILISTYPYPRNMAHHLASQHVREQCSAVTCMVAATHFEATAHWGCMCEHHHRPPLTMQARQLLLKPLELRVVNVHLHRTCSCSFEVVTRKRCTLGGQQDYGYPPKTDKATTPKYGTHMQVCTEQNVSDIITTPREVWKQSPLTS
jgi:hypothetical protein